MSMVATPWTQDEIVRLMDPEALGEGHYRAPAHGECERNVVEGGQQIGVVIVAAAKELPEHRVTSLALAFSRVARHDLPLDIELDVLRRGSTQSIMQVRISQDDRLCSAGTVHLDAGSVDLIRDGVEPPDVARPEGLQDLSLAGFEVGGRQIRVVDDAYDWDPGHVGPPELFVWERFAEPVATAAMNAAVLAHATTQWTIAAALRPHAGFTEIDAHRTFSSGISMVTVALHEPADVSRWMLYANRATHAGSGTAQGEGRIHDESGRLLASYAVHCMIRPLLHSGPDRSRLM